MRVWISSDETVFEDRRNTKESYVFSAKASIWMVSIWSTSHTTSFRLGKNTRDSSCFS